MKKSSRALLLSILLTSTLTVFSTTPTFAERREETKDDTAATSSTHYNADTAKFLYTTGRYIEASIACKRILEGSGGGDFPERNHVVLIKWLSDLRLGYTDMSFGFRSATFAELPELTEVFDILYRRGDFETLVKLSEGVEGPLARYFQGLSLYATGNFNEAERKLLKIPSSFELYAHAELTLSQIMITREDTESALRHLRLAKEAAKKKKDPELKDRIDLNIGYILFNQGDFKAAKANFARVGRSDKLKNEALSAKAWAKVKQNDCKGAISAIAKLKPLSQFTKSSQELMVLEAYCQNDLGNRDEALASLTRAIDLFQALEASYATVYIGGQLPFGIIELLSPEDIADRGEDVPYRVEYGTTPYPVVEGDATTEAATSPTASTQALFFLEGLKSAATTDDSSVLALAEDNYRALKLVASLYRKKERELDLLASSMARKVKAKKEALIFVKNHALSIKEKLSKLSSIIYSRDGSLKGLSFTPSQTKAEIVRRWEKHLNRPVTELEKKVIDIVMLDGEDGVWYLNNTQYCQFLYWMAIDQTKADPASDELGVIEKVIRDLEITSTGAKTPYEILLPQLEPMVHANNKDDEERVKTLIVLKGRIHEKRILAEAATEKVRLEIEAILVRRAGLMRFDIRSVLEKAFTLLKDIERKEAK